MEITAVTRLKGTRYRVEVDGEYWNVLDAEVLADFDLHPGKEVDEALLDEALLQAQRRRARERAYYLMSCRDHSAGELLEKLSKTVDDGIALQTVVRLQEIGIVNDMEYARKLARNLLDVKRYGAFRAKQEMREKKLSDEIIEQALDEALAERDPLEPLRELVEKKYRRQLGSPEGRRRAVAALMRYGHSYADVRTVLEEFGEDSAGDDWAE